MIHALALTGSAVLALWVASRVARRPTVATTPFVWLSAAIAVWSLAGAGHALAEGVDAKLVWARLQYTGIASAPPLWLLFTAEYAGAGWLERGRRLRRLIWIVPVLTIAAALTNEWHRALWTGVSLRPDGAAEYGHGWWFWIAASYNYALVLAGSVLVTRALGRWRPFRAQMVALLAAVVVPWAGNALYISGVTFGPITDATPLAFTASYVLFAWALYRRHLFDFVPVARDVVVDSLTDAVVVMDRFRRIVDVNAAARALGDVAALVDGIPLETASLSVTSPTLKTDGMPSTFDVRVLPVRSRWTTRTAWVMVLRDVSAQRRAAAERDALRERIQEQQRRESLSILAGGLAHDFNNLLASIIGNADLLALKLPAAPSVGGHLSTIQLGAQRAADLVSKMLAYAGERHGSMARIDLDPLTRELLELVRASAARHCTVTYEGQTGIVYADPTQVRQVAMNLLINAAEAVGDGGHVTVRTGADTLSRERLETMRFGQDGEPGEFAFLEVADDGPGMDARTLQRIFDPFFTTKASGHGLGLAAVQGIVIGHRGALSVESAEGRGTRFCVWLPLAGAVSSDPFGPFTASELRDTAFVGRPDPG